MKNSTIFFLAAILAFAVVNSSQAQQKQPFRAGFQINQLQGDFGLGIQLDVPLPGYWPNLRLSGTHQWLEVPGESTTETASFQTIRLGIAPNGWQVAEKIRVYGEGGLLVLFPEDALSAKDMVNGGYGLFGFEFFTGTVPGSSLFLEMGGTAAGRRVNRRDGVPAFGAGLLLGSGFRLAFGK